MVSICLTLPQKESDNDYHFFPRQIFFRCSSLYKKKKKLFLSLRMELPKLKHPSTCMISGPTGSGKTFFIKRLIEEKMLTPMPQHIVYCYGAYQPLFNTLKNVDFQEGLPNNASTYQDALIIIDDLMTELSNDTRLSKLFTKGSHHKKLSIVFVVQNLFNQGKEMRTIHLNSQYLVLYKNPRDKSQVMHLARQMFPGKTKAFQEIFQDATTPAYGYLFLDLRPETDERLRMRTGIFPHDKHYVYEPR